MQPVFIVASEASGGRELAGVLSANGVALLAAAFDIENRYDYSFAHFLRSANVGAAELIATPDQVLDDYLSECADLVRDECFCLDVHPHFMHIFNGRSSVFGQRPNLVVYLRQRQFRVVQFGRRSLFEQAVRRQIPGVEPGQQSPGFALDIKRCERDLRLLEHDRPRMANWFQGYDRFYDVAHGAVFEAGTVSDSGARLLEAIFDRPIANRTPPLPLQHHDLSRLVSNAAEVVAAFADSPQAEAARALLAMVKAAS